MSFAALLQSVDETTREKLGEDVVYTPGVGDAETVRGIYDAAYTRVDAGNAGASSSTPAVFLRLSDLSSDPSDDTACRVTAGGTEYKVREAEPDGQGGVLLFLQRVA
jgi:hypothetical protein